MKLELEEVKLRISNTDDDRQVMVDRMKAWEKMYCLDAGFSQNWQDAIKQDGREQVTSPDPYNVILLAMRLLPSQPKIDIPPRDNTNATNLDAQQVERWLTAMYNRVNWQQGSNFVDDLKLSVFRRGVGYIQALWIRDDLPENLRKKRFPILIRTLDPLSVGFKRGPMYVEYAYEKCNKSKMYVRQLYPNLKRWEKPKVERSRRVKTESDEVEVTDFWYTDESDASVWHCVIIDDEFAMEPKKTDYPFIPIIEIKGEGDGFSVLHAIDGLWQYKCRLLSNIGTGVLWATWPFFLITNDQGYTVPDFDVKPLATQNAPAGTQVNQVRPDVNLSVLTAMLAQVEGQISQATFPSVMYGDAGNMQAGYGVNILSQAAGGRVNTVREAIERGLMWLHELILALVEAFDDDDNGVELWGRDAGSEKLYKICLYKRQIDGYYENAVQLKLNLPTDDQARQTFGLRLVETKTLSKQSFWDKYLGITVPGDEQDRIDAEIARENPDVQRKLAVLSFMKEYPETWEAVLAGTPLLDIAYQMAEKTMPPELLATKDGYMAWKMKPPQLPMGPPPGMPPLMAGNPPSHPSMQPPAMMSGPLGGGVPPVMQGQMSAENLGLPHHTNPALFAQIMGQPLPPNEELAALSGPPPVGGR